MLPTETPYWNGRQVIHEKTCPDCRGSPPYGYIPEHDGSGSTENLCEAGNHCHDGVMMDEDCECLTCHCIYVAHDPRALCELGTGCEGCDTVRGALAVTAAWVAGRMEYRGSEDDLEDAKRTLARIRDGGRP